jgi:Abortive infection alpha
MPDMTTAAVILGGAVAIAKPAVETACKLIENLLGEPCKVAGGMIADQIYLWQWTNRIQIANRAKQILDEQQVAAAVVPPGFLIPLLDSAGNVDDPELQEMWARLLASTVVDIQNGHPAFINVLRALSRDEARILESGSPRLFLMNEGKTPFTPVPGMENAKLISSRRGFSHWVNVPLCIQMLKDQMSEDDVRIISAIHKDSVLIYATHLESLGLVTLKRRKMEQPIHEHLLEIRHSPFGKAFVKACCKQGTVEGVVSTDHIAEEF